MILYGTGKRWPWVKHQFADGAYDRLKLMDKAVYLDFASRSSGGPAPPMGCRAHLRLDDPMAAPRPRL